MSLIASARVPAADTHVGTTTAEKCHSINITARDVAVAVTGTKAELLRWALTVMDAAVRI
jgi:hypothetical protein